MQQAFQKLALRLSGVDEAPKDFESLKKQDAIKLISDLQTQVAVLSERERVALQDARGSRELASEQKEQISRLKQQLSFMLLKQQSVETELSTLRELEKTFMRAISPAEGEAEDPESLASLGRVIAKLEDQLLTAASSAQETRVYYLEREEQCKAQLKSREDELAEKDGKLFRLGLELTEAQKTASDRAGDVGRIELALREKAHALGVAEAKQSEQLKELSLLTVQSIKANSQIMDMEQRFQDAQRAHDEEKASLCQRLEAKEAEAAAIEKRFYDEKRARQGDAETFQEEMEGLRAMLEESQEKCKGFEAERATLLEAAASSEKELSKLQETVNESGRRQFQMQQELERTRARAEQGQDGKAKAEARAEELLGRLAEAEKSLRRVTEEKGSRMRDAEEAAAREASQLQARLETVLAEAARAREEAQSLRSEIEKTTRREAALQSRLAETEKRARDGEVDLIRALKMQYFGWLEQQKDFEGIQRAQLRLQEAGERGELAAMRELMAEM